ncbi:response regulator transcription factor [Sutterella wadsworthensis]|uniref:response regulator transcription factor n=1 Tax=Sutterella wadsworthensis TaxID=40545 RepID=UPI003C705552
MLDMEGWKTVTYGRAEDFFTGDSPSEPGCVVLDVRMPGMSGIEAQHEMRSRGIALPIIFLTGHGDVDMAVGAVQDGAFDFLLKPVDNERFLNSVACAAWVSAAAAAGLPGEDSLERLAALTKRERSLAQLIALGLTNREAAERSGIAQRTMEVHRANILRKLGVKTPEDIRRLLEMAADEKA